jgi:hypothetical protein
MPRGRTIMKELCWIVVIIASCGRSAVEIKVFTSISERSQQQILRHWHSSGEVRTPGRGSMLAGGPLTYLWRKWGVCDTVVTDTFEHKMSLLYNTLPQLGTPKFTTVVALSTFVFQKKKKKGYITAPYGYSVVKFYEDSVKKTSATVELLAQTRKSAFAGDGTAEIRRDKRD